MTKTFKGVEMALGPGRLYPRNSAIEAVERRRIAGEEAVQSLARIKVVAAEKQKKSAVKKHENLAERDQWIREQYARKVKVKAKYSVHSFRDDLLTAWSNRNVQGGREKSSTRRVPGTSPIRIPRKLWKLLRPNGKLIEKARLGQIIRIR